MASLNIDAALIKNSKLVQTEERLIEMQNGCICCTLREDLVTEVGALARSGQFDYLVIESTGIGEPQQVAETFTLELQDEHGSVSLSEIARLDTCVTVVDAAQLLPNAASVESLAQRGEAATEEDDRNVADLLLDQIEFADVIILNKMDLVTPQEARRLQAFIKTLNPDAEILAATNSEVDMVSVINTGKFSFEKAARSAGWLQSMQEETPHTPETLEYGIGTFLYKARRAFHPGRLHRFMTQYFLLQEPDWRDAIEDKSDDERDENDENEELGEDGDDDAFYVALQSAEAASVAAQQTAEALSQLELYANKEALIEAASAAVTATAAIASLLTEFRDSSTSKTTTATTTTTPSTAPNVSPTTPLSSEEAAAAEERRQRLHSSFGQVLRAKGFAWVSSRPDLCAEWSQAGGVLRFTVGGPWYAALPDEAWPQDPEHRADVMRDFQGPDGDRRQELVFIGIDMNQKALTLALDACLLRNGEEIGEDPFAEWPLLEQILDGGDDDVEDDMGGDLSPPGKVLDIFEGAAELQEALEKVSSGGAAFVLWHADWIPQSMAACSVLDRLAAEHPGVLVARLDVEISPANRALAMEKVMKQAHCRRQGAKPILRNEGRFPAISVHYASNLQPAELLTGDQAVQRATEAIIAAAADAAEAEADRIQEALRNGETDVAPVVAVKTATKLTSGAGQFKTLLMASRDSGKDAVVIWSSSAYPQKHDELKAAAAEAAAAAHVDIIFADVAATSANAVLADALGARALPAIYIFKGMKLDKKVFGVDATPAAVLEAAQIVPETTTTAAAGVDVDVNRRSSIDSDRPPQEAAVKSVTKSLRKPSEFDPPTGKFARAGTAKRMGDGRTGHFFPKMPCLRCGCPWWSSDDWNAKCLRCSWDCEIQGYDDDSKPLPAFVKKWESLTAVIKEGRTPEWKGR